jgi:hypothetical protein
MGTLLAATAPSRTIVIERGGTAWWVPFLTALLVAVLAVVASYYATWKFKKVDVNRESAFRTADLVNQAEQIASWPGRYGAEAEGGAESTMRLLQEARIRAQPLGDDDLDDSFKAAGSYGRTAAIVGRRPIGSRAALATRGDCERPSGDRPAPFPAKICRSDPAA